MDNTYYDHSRQSEPGTSRAGTSTGTNSFPDHATPLKDRAQWLCSQNRSKGGGKKPGKVPINPMNPSGLGIDYTDSDNWMSHDEAKRHYEENPLIHHYGFVTHEGDLYSFIDIDERIDAETGEVPPVIMKLMEQLDSYAYITPNHGVRIVIQGELNDTGGNYVWVDPDTGEEHVFEVYDRKRYLVFTDRVFHDEPIKEAQYFLDSLVKNRSDTSSSRKTRATDLPEIELPEDLEEARNKIKLLFIKHDLNPGPILEGSRKTTLISCFRTIVRNEHVEISGEPETEPDELWELINCANQTMLYDEHGEDLEGLSREELEEVYETVLKNLPDKSPKEVQEKLDDLCGFLGAIKVRINYRQNSKWKVMKALEEHGRKYGSLQYEYWIRVDIGWVALQKQARIGSTKTLETALKKLESLGIITRGRDEGDRTGHFVINLKKAMEPNSWGIEEEGLYAQGNNSDTLPHHLCIPVHKELTERVPKEVLEALIHSTWYRHVGPTKIRYVLAILIIDKVLIEEATSTKIAEVVGVQPSSVSRPLKELKNAGVIHQDRARGPYRVEENVAEDLQRFRSIKGEFNRDEKSKRQARDQRKCYKYQVKLQDIILQLLEDGKNPDDALEEAKKLVPPPKGIPKYKLAQHQGWALRWAEKKKERSSQSKNTHSTQTGGAKRANDDARLRNDVREGYFHEQAEDQRSSDGH